MYIYNTSGIYVQYVNNICVLYIVVMNETFTIPQRLAMTNKSKTGKKPTHKRPHEEDEASAVHEPPRPQAQQSFGLGRPTGVTTGPTGPTGRASSQRQPQRAMPTKKQRVALLQPPNKVFRL